MNSLYLCVAILAALLLPTAPAAAVDLPLPPGASAEDEPTEEPTPEATPEPTEIPSVCGNGLLESDEDCEGCPDDCVTEPGCEPSGKTRKQTFRLVPAEDSYALGFALRLPYRGTALAIPGNDFDAEVGERVALSKETSHLVARDVGHSLRLVITDRSGLEETSFTVTFDTCKGASAAKDDVLCIVEGCTTRGRDIEGCRCEPPLEE